MSLRSGGSQYQSTLVKIAAVAGVAGVHLAVAAAIWLSSGHDQDLTLPDTASIQFIEISDEFVDAAPAQTSAEPDMAQSQPEAEAAPEPEPVIEPEPAVPPEPDPLPEPEPEPEPQPVPEPEMVAPAPKKPEPKPKPEVKPAPKPQPKPRPTPAPKPAPKPTPTPAPKPAPQPSPAPSPDAAPAASASGQSQNQATPKAPVATPDSNTPRFISQVDYAGRRPVPDYPRASVRRGETGRVLVRVLISPSGTVEEVSVRKSSGHSRLDSAALKAAKMARFKPYKENGVALPALADIPFDFVL